ncbi:hypothetical protein COOONC_09261 [Cooperia oncophora]
MVYQQAVCPQLLYKNNDSNEFCIGGVAIRSNGFAKRSIGRLARKKPELQDYLIVTEARANILICFQLLLCTHREGWSFHEQRTRFTQNLRNVDDRFDFGIADFVLRDF